MFDLSLNIVNQILENCAEFKFDLISVKPLSTVDGSVGFMSESGRWLIKYKTENCEKELKIFIKYLPNSGFLRKFVIETRGFFREEQCYSLLLNNFQNLTNDHVFPKFYFGSDEVIVLEDLYSDGFKNKDIQQLLDLQHCQIALKTLAKFHGASFAFESKNNIKLIKSYPHIFVRKSDLKSKNYQTGPPTKWHAAGIEVFEILMSKYFPNKYSTEIIKEGIDVINNLSLDFHLFSKYPNVLINGDCWGGNIMYKYSDENVPSGACIIDFQLCRYSIPTLDVLFYIYVATCKQFRDCHLNYLLDYYYNELKTQLCSMDMDIESILNLSLYREMCKVSLPHVLAKTILYLQFVLLPETKLKKFKINESEFTKLYGGERAEIVLEYMNENEHFKSRVLESISEFFDYLNTKKEIL